LEAYGSDNVRFHTVPGLFLKQALTEADAEAERRGCMKRQSMKVLHTARESSISSPWPGKSVRKASP
jgi:hypothetical protein